MTFSEVKDALGEFAEDTNLKSTTIEYGLLNRNAIGFISKSFKYKMKTIVGIDIYQYSQYPVGVQTIIPFVFDLIFAESIRLCKQENLVFYKYSFKNNFIHTGDGGFQIFDSPLQALVFVINFYAVLRLYNSNRFYPKLNRITNEIVLRTCITTDKVFKYANNQFGPGIINNARILSRDKLNRLLIDENTYKWFLIKCNGFESISCLKLSDVIDIVDAPQGVYSSSLFNNNCPEEELKDKNISSKIRSCHVQKIGMLKMKNTVVSVYNIEIQANIYMDMENKTGNQFFVLSIGNSNIDGVCDP